MWSSIFRPWFFSSDDYVVVGEVIRFVQLDFRQHFFDMPGTPFMFIAAIAWSGFYALQVVLGRAPGGIAAFTFQHLPALFVRVESLSVCCLLGALLCVIYHFDGRRAAAVADDSGSRGGFFDLMFFAGVLAGVGAAARLHSITASLPVLMLFLLASPRPANRLDYPRWVKAAVVAAAVLLAAAGFEVFRFNTRLGPLPHARSLLITTWYGAAGGLVVCVVTYWTAIGRRLLLRIIDTTMARMLLVVGLVCVVIRRDRRILSIAAGAALFFVSKPMSILPQPHHVILWLPLFAIVCSYPAAVVAERLPAIFRHGRAAAFTAVAA